MNVIGLFNGAIPLIAIQMQAYKVGEHITLVFTTVMNELTRGVVDEDEAADAAPTDRLYWERKASPNMVKMTDQLLVIAKDFDPTEWGPFVRPVRWWRERTRDPRKRIATEPSSGSPL